MRAPVRKRLLKANPRTRIVRVSNPIVSVAEIIGCLERYAREARCARHLQRAVELYFRRVSQERRDDDKNFRRTLETRDDQKDARDTGRDVSRQRCESMASQIISDATSLRNQCAANREIFDYDIQSRRCVPLISSDLHCPLQKRLSQTRRVHVRDQGSPSKPSLNHPCLRLPPRAMRN